MQLNTIWRAIRKATTNAIPQMIQHCLALTQGDDHEDLPRINR
jgi:hypothetical protein